MIITAKTNPMNNSAGLVHTFKLEDKESKYDNVVMIRRKILDWIEAEGNTLNLTALEYVLVEIDGKIRAKLDIAIIYKIVATTLDEDWNYTYKED